MSKELGTELILGLVAAAGTSRQATIEHLTQTLTRLQYKVEVIKVSEKVIPPSLAPNQDGASYYERTKALMDAGDTIRESSKEAAILAQGVAARIAELRHQVDESAEPKNRQAYIIDSLKRPEEVSLLKFIYNEGFYLIGIFSPPDRRRKNLCDKNMSDIEANELMERDEQGRRYIETVKQQRERKYGQRTRDTFQLADYFVHDLHLDSPRNGLVRFLHLIFGDPWITPMFEEYAMFMAFAASLRSADPARQVGAVIARDKEIISTGANDCPKAFGGLYWPTYDRLQGLISDTENGRDYTRKTDSNVKARENLVDILTQRILDEFTQGMGDPNELREILRNSPLRDITEFGRSVHAEMEALLACARNGASTLGSTIYCTTFPCHNCARHIIAAGVKRVVYVEPYPKSKALDLHDDAISHTFSTDVDEKGKVIFEPFMGVGPRRFFDLFSLEIGSGYPIERKKSTGELASWDEKRGKLRLQLLPHTYIERELMMAESFLASTNAKEGGKHDARPFD